MSPGLVPVDTMEVRSSSVETFLAELEGSCFQMQAGHFGQWECVQTHMVKPLGSHQHHPSKPGSCPVSAVCVSMLDMFYTSLAPFGQRVICARCSTISRLAVIYLGQGWDW